MQKKLEEKFCTTNKKNIISIFDYSKYLTFYKIMKYPIPNQFHYFLFEKKINSEWNNLLNNTQSKNSFSRNEKNPYMEEYIAYINKYWWLYRSLPFVKEVYLCNSITFNALKENSDIDLFIVAQKWKLRLARFFSVAMFSLLWLKRSLTDKSKKFCLSFYITQDAKNLYWISLPKVDVYLIYWLSHLVPLYFENKINNEIFKQNSWYHSLLPNSPHRFIINIWNTIFYWKTRIKKIIEFSFWGIIGFLSQILIKLIRLPIVIRKRKKLWEQWRWIIITNNMLKFHKDQRKKIHLLFKISKQPKTNN